MPQISQEQFIDASWREFEENYDFKRKFGLQALEQKLNAERKGQGLHNIDQQYVMDALGQLNISGLQQDIDKHLDDKLREARKMRGPEMGTYAKQTFDQVNRDVPQDAPRQGAQHTPPWPNGDKIDFAGNPSIRKAVQALTDAAQNNQPAEFTTAFDRLKDELQNELKNQYKNRMAMRATPTRKVDAKPY